MKKKLVASLAAAVVLGIAGTSFAAAAKPFADVPAKHWSYGSVMQLQQAGIIDGYSDNQFQGDKVITRYEMAQIVGKAMNKSDKATAEQKVVIDKLATEFRSELENLGVEVAALKDKVDNVKIDGYASVQFQNRDAGKWFEKANGWRYGGADSTQVGVKLRIHAAVSDEWTVHSELEDNIALSTGRDGKNGGNGNYLSVNKLYVEGPVLRTNAYVGKFDPKEVNGIRDRAFDPMFFDTLLTGVKFEFGNQVKTQLFYGKTDGNSGIPGIQNNFQTYSMAKFNTVLGKSFNVGAMFHNVKPGDSEKATLKNVWGKDTVNAVELTFGTPIQLPIPGKWYTWGDVIKTNASDRNKAYHLGLSYNDPPDRKVAGTWGAWTMYHHQQAHSALNPFGEAKDREIEWDQALGGSAGFKGWEFGINYTPAKNHRIMIREIIGKPIDPFSQSGHKMDTNQKAFRLTWELYF